MMKWLALGTRLNPLGLSNGCIKRSEEGRRSEKKRVKRILDLVLVLVLGLVEENPP